MWVMSKPEPVAPSAKQQLVLTAERLFAIHGLDGVPLRRIGTEAGMANKSAVQYHFGTKEGLIEAILFNRVDDLTRRRALLEARVQVGDLRGTVEAHQLPLIELGEDENCYYLPFLEKLTQHEHPLENLPASHRGSEVAYYDRLRTMLDFVPQPLRDIRINQVSSVCLHVCADRHRRRTLGLPIAPYALHVSQLLDGLVAILATPPSDETLAALEGVPSDQPPLRLLP